MSIFSSLLPRGRFNRFPFFSSDHSSAPSSPSTTPLTSSSHPAQQGTFPIPGSPSSLDTCPIAPSRPAQHATPRPISSPSQSLSCTAADLSALPLPTPSFSISELLPEGLTLLGAKDPSMLTSLSVHLS